MVEVLADEVLVYDRERKRAHCLNRVAAAVWQSCDGRLDPVAIRKAASAALGEVLTPAAVDEALRQLAHAHLLTERPAKRAPRNPGRRAMLAGLLIPVVLSIPIKAQAASKPGCHGDAGPCTSDADCCTNLGFTCQDVGMGMGMKVCKK